MLQYYCIYSNNLKYSTVYVDVIYSNSPPLYKFKIGFYFLYFFEAKKHTQPPPKAFVVLHAPPAEQGDASAETEVIWTIPSGSLT